MDRSSQSQVTVTKRASERAVCCRHKPICRQRHDENSRRANDAADDDDAIRRDALRQRTNHRCEHNDENSVDPGQFADRSVQPHLAIAKLRKDVIHLEEDRLQKSDEEKENQQLVKGGLPDQAMEKRDRVFGAFLDSLRNFCPKAGASGPRFIDGAIALCVASQKIDGREEQDLQREAYGEELFMRRRLESSDVYLEIE